MMGRLHFLLPRWFQGLCNAHFTGILPMGQFASGQTTAPTGMVHGLRFMVSRLRGHHPHPLMRAWMMTHHFAQGPSMDYCKLGQIAAKSDTRDTNTLRRWAPLRCDHPPHDRPRDRKSSDLSRNPPPMMMGLWRMLSWTWTSFKAADLWLG